MCIRDRFLIDGESIFAGFKTVRDQVVFTNKRVIAANVQGITGSKVDYTSLPYSKINAFSIETSGTLDPVSYTHLTLPTNKWTWRSRWAPDH
ncbi:PH domain-containing protein [Vibrio harveyi]|uniref:PH domain-containing protein n=1 Tax=Vibrio harveyi TaxID=669 RepID=UPI001FD40EE4|nr:PH domain-containing protein [Vibrio harveyi]